MEATKERKLTSFVTTPEAMRMVWVRDNKAVAEIDPDQVLGKLYDMYQEIQTLKAQVKDLPPGLKPVEMSVARTHILNPNVMFLDIKITGLFPKEQTPTYVHAKLIKGSRGIYPSALKDGYKRGVAAGKGANKAELSKIEDTPVLNGALAKEVEAFLQPANLKKLLAGTDAAEFFGATEAPKLPEIIKNEEPTIEL